MPSPQGCVLASLVLAYIPHWYRTFGVVRPGLARRGKAYDVRYSRSMVAQMTDSTPEGLLVTRLTSCHQNGLEAFAAFGISIAVALSSGAPKDSVGQLANYFVLVRVAYTAIFWSAALNGVLRSIAWLIGFLITCRIFLL